MLLSKGGGSVACVTCSVDMQHLYASFEGEAENDAINASSLGAIRIYHTSITMASCDGLYCASRMILVGSVLDLTC